MNYIDFKKNSILMLESVLGGIEITKINNSNINAIKQNIFEAMELIQSLEFSKDCCGWVIAKWNGSENIAHPELFEYSIEKFKENLIQKLSCLGKFNKVTLYIENNLKLIVEQYNKIF